MAQLKEIRLVDDLDGGDADVTVEFGIDGRSYEIDLSIDNATRLRESVAQFIEHARRASGRAKRGHADIPSATRSAVKAQNQAIREWAHSQGMEVAERGRIPQPIIDAYNAA